MQYSAGDIHSARTRFGKPHNADAHPCERIIGVHSVYDNPIEIRLGTCCNVYVYPSGHNPDVCNVHGILLLGRRGPHKRNSACDYLTACSLVCCTLHESANPFAYTTGQYRSGGDTLPIRGYRHLLTLGRTLLTLGRTHAGLEGNVRGGIQTYTPIHCSIFSW